MATLATFAAALETAIASVVTGAGGTFRATPMRAGWDFALASGETTAFGDGIPSGKNRDDSNADLDVILATIRVAHSLPFGGTESVALGGVLAAVMRSLSDPAFYRALSADVHDLSDEVDQQPEFERVGQVLRADLRIRLSLKP